MPQTPDEHGSVDVGKGTPHFQQQPLASGRQGCHSVHQWQWILHPRQEIWWQVVCVLEPRIHVFGLNWLTWLKLCEKHVCRFVDLFYSARFQLHWFEECVVYVYLRPAEQVKQAEKSTEAEDIALTDKHNEALRQWGDLSVWQGCVDVVTKHLGAESSSARAQRGSKVSKDLKHLTSWRNGFTISLPSRQCCMDWCDICDIIYIYTCKEFSSPTQKHIICFNHTL